MIAKDMIVEAEKELTDIYKKINDIEYANSFKVLNAFREISGISEEEILNKVVKYFNEIKDIV